MEENKKNSVEKKDPLNQTRFDNSPEEFSSANKSNFVPINNLKYLINNLSYPRFLGSIHLKKEMNPNYADLENMLVNEKELKLTKSLKNTIFNPITKILLISVIIFNLIWFLSMYLL
ncbi:MAG: hypothetical protein ACXAEX_04895 [Promethearchaeota archaeon]|jgi:hypothetical protein